MLFERRRPTASTLDDRPGCRAVGSLTLSPSDFLTLATLFLEMGGIGLGTGALNDCEFGHGQTAAIGSTSSSSRSFSLRIAASISLKQQNDRGGPDSIGPQVTVCFQGLFAFLFYRQYFRALRSMASKLRSTSASVVAQDDTLIRIAVRPCQTVTPHQQVPSV